MGLVSQTLRDSAKGQECTMQSDFCNHDPETTVLAHLPSPVKGAGNKGDDWHSVFACSACHDALDQRRLSTVDLVQTIHALRITQKYWFDNGDLIIAGAKETKAKPTSKSLPVKNLFGRK